ncbi:protein RRNAD1-like, partial [Trifolium medium]|nr:protein RRNAD1-like [Trifolium medium]
PKTITCRVLSIESLKALVETSMPRDDLDQSMLKGENQEVKGKLNCPGDANNRPPTVLAGLHACGDLSVIMLK